MSVAPAAQGILEKGLFTKSTYPSLLPPLMPLMVQSGEMCQSVSRLEKHSSITLAVPRQGSTDR